MEMLRQISENDYEFQSQSDGYNSCWITVKNLSVYLKRTDEGVVVDIFVLGYEAEDPLASTYAFFNEAENIHEQE